MLGSVIVGRSRRLCREGTMWIKFQKMELTRETKKENISSITYRPCIASPQRHHKCGQLKAIQEGWIRNLGRKNNWTWGTTCRKLPVYKGCLCLAKEVRLCPIINGKPLIGLKQDDDVLIFTLWQHDFNSRSGIDEGEKAWSQEAIGCAYDGYAYDGGFIFSW